MEDGMAVSEVWYRRRVLIKTTSLSVDWLLVRHIWVSHSFGVSKYMYFDCLLSLFRHSHTLINHNP